MSEKEIVIEHFDKPRLGAEMVLEKAGALLQAMGYTQESYGSDATGSLRVLRKGDIVVSLGLSTGEKA